MKTTSKTIVFFGSGPVAAASLAYLAEHFDVEAVITKPQPSHHKEPFPVLTLAEKLGIKTYTPVGKRELSELFATKPVTSTLGVVIDYGFIINQDVIDYFPLGIVNSHFSLLPEWRGADPITFAILSGQQQTGVSLMLIDEKMDEGPLLDASILADKTPTYSRKLTKQDGILDFNKSAEVLEREIRAYQEWPKSRTAIAGKDVIILKAHASISTGAHVIGEAYVDDRQLIIPTSDGALFIDSLQPAGKKIMTAEAFLAGHKHLL
jgi:methionyl-tRNA formyltransferase